MLESVNVSQTGKYAGEEMATRKLLDYAPHLTLFPSICRRHNCYTLTLSLNAGAPPVVFDIGAPAERLRALGVGHILDYALVDAPRKSMTPCSNSISGRCGGRRRKPSATLTPPSSSTTMRGGTRRRRKMARFRRADACDAVGGGSAEDAPRRAGPD